MFSYCTLRSEPHVTSKWIERLIVVPKPRLQKENTSREAIMFSRLGLKTPALQEMHSQRLEKDSSTCAATNQQRLTPAGPNLEFANSFA